MEGMACLSDIIKSKKLIQNKVTLGLSRSMRRTCVDSIMFDSNFLVCYLKCK